MTKHIFSYVKLSIWGLLAMTCISCAHQTREASLMIDTDTLTEEHVWSESRDVQETIAAEGRSEEDQLSEIEKKEENTSTSLDSAEAKTDESLSENSESNGQELASVDSNVSSSESKWESSDLMENSNGSEKTEGDSNVANLNDGNKPESILAASTTVAKNDEGVLETEKVTTPMKEESEAPARDVSSEAPMDEVTPPSRVVPTIGVPGRLKLDESPPAPKKPSPRSKKLLINETTIAKMVAPKAPEISVEVKGPTIEITQKETGIVSKEKEEATQMNELGEEQDPSALLASVEIANFVQNHLLALLMVGGVFVVGLFFLMRRKKEEDNQQPI
ncbi:MAG: hypothetical protein FJ116_02010 [Deltaproteobacteria bacterium]|nr:hypothetical protein [Deltaproteobacteria bacterium]